MQAHVRFTARIAQLLVLTLCWNVFAHAAKPSRRLALLHAAMQTQTSTPAAPESTAAKPQSTGVRDRLRFAHTLALTEIGNDQYFVLSKDDVFNSALDAMNHWGRYKIVTDVTQADLVLQLHGVVTATDTAGAPDPTTGTPTSSVSYYDSLQVTVADPHTMAPLWVVNLPVQPALRSKARATNTALLGSATVSQLKLLVGDPLTHQEQVQLKQATNRHLGLILGVSAAGVAAVIGLFFLGRHAAQQNQASFCQQHGITPCPGS